MAQKNKKYEKARMKARIRRHDGGLDLEMAT